MKIQQGKSVYKGIAIGKISIYQNGQQVVKRRHVDDVEAEIKRFEDARDLAVEQLGNLYEKALTEVGEANAAIFEVHQMMLEDLDYEESIINIIRNGRNFNRDYYHHATTVLAKGDPKKYGTSIGMPILVMVLIIVVNIAIALISTAVMVSSLQSSFADNVVDGYYDDVPDIHSIEPELSATPEPQNTTDISAGSSAEPEINNYRRYEGFFATTNSAEDYLSSGGPSVELHVDGEYLYYCVSSQQENYPRSAFLEGFADMDGSSVISFYGEDSWSNLVSGNIYLLDNGNVAVESEVLEYDPNSMWDLDISYVELVPCLSDPTGSSGTTSSGYLYPSDSQYITEYELSQYTHDEIVLIRNEIYARHGCNFNDSTIRSYFESQSWYYPIDGLNASNFDSSVLNEYELTNIDTILAYEREMGWRS